jgi:hypothetical protein
MKISRLLLAAGAAALLWAAPASAQDDEPISADSLLTVFNVTEKTREDTWDAVDRVSELRCGERAGLEDGECMAELETGAGLVCRSAGLVVGYRAILRRRGVRRVHLRCTGRSVSVGIHTSADERRFLRLEIFDREGVTESFYMVPLARIAPGYDPPAPPRERPRTRRTRPA